MHIISVRPGQRVQELYPFYKIVCVKAGIGGIILITLSDSFCLKSNELNISHYI